MIVWCFNEVLAMLFHFLSIILTSFEIIFWSSIKSLFFGGFVFMTFSTKTQTRITLSSLSFPASISFVHSSFNCDDQR